MLTHDLDHLTTQFVQGLLAVLRHATVHDLVALQARAGGRAAPEPVPSARSAPESALPKRRGRPPKAKPAPPPKRRGRPRKDDAPAAPVRGARKAAQKPEAKADLAEQVLGALAKEPEGLSSEALQRVIALAATELRAVLAELVVEGRLLRHGQARGTRYQLPAARKRRAAEAPVEETPFPRPEGVTELPKPVEAPAPELEPEPVEVLNELRGHLARSGTALLSAELEKLLNLPRPRVRRALGQLTELGLVAKEGRGLGVRYQLVAQPVEEPKAEESPAPAGRVIRRRARDASPVIRRVGGRSELRPVTVPPALPAEEQPLPR